MVTPKGSLSTEEETLQVSSRMPPSGETCKYSIEPSTYKKKTCRDSVPIDMLLSASFVLVVTQPSSEILEGLLNYPVLSY